MPNLESDTANFKSLNLAYSEAKNLIEVQFRQIDGLDTKASNLLAATGIVLSVLISGQILSIFLNSKTGSPEYVMADYVLLGSASLFTLVSVILGVIALYVRHYKLSPDPRIIRTEYLNWTEEQTKLQILDNLILNFEDNAKTLSKKAALLQYGFTLFGFGTALLVIIFIVNLARHWGT